VISADVVVVGAGVMGSSTARWLARSGREVVVLEQFEPGHTRGSSHGTSRIFRFSYHDPMYVRMAQEALSLWRELEDEAGEPLLDVTGGVDVGPGADSHAEAMEACGVAFDRLDPRERARRFPQVRLPEEGTVLFQADSAVIAADRAVGAFAAGATRRGAELRHGVRVRRLSEEDGGAVLHTDDEEYRARVAVITAGAWARGLLQGLGIDVPTRPTRETVAYFRVPEGPAYPTLVDWGSPAVYSLPSPGQGIKAGQHIAGPVTDPDEEGRVSEESVATLREWIARRYPEADPEPHHAETCLYTNTPDESFILERHGPFVIGSPCSGHGFKFSPLIGKRLAGLVEGPPGPG
jgi:sarcosine oxidase